VEKWESRKIIQKIRSKTNEKLQGRIDRIERIE
jgi:hypothetical protein